MAITSYVSAAEAAAIQGEFRNLEATIKAVFWDVTWTAWTKDRPENGPTESWNAGTADETWYLAGSGTGRLNANGAGGPVVGENIIYQQAPYRLKTDVSEALTPHMWLVVDGTRLFKVEGFEDRAGLRQHGTAYLTEIFGQAIPEVAP